ncbi:MAG: hypothetical protein L0Y44_00375, partial [Phycisphaerales bacterium]|nr:hypothetical protein [Phycisphaerales bacterium]MCI0674173.1 hypothetical protein [Phycisphaerales bacterium]
MRALTSQPLNAQDARSALKALIPDPWWLDRAVFIRPNTAPCTAAAPRRCNVTELEARPPQLNDHQEVAHIHGPITAERRDVG